MPQNLKQYTTLISARELEDLMKIQDPHCVSLFIPTSRAGEEVDRGHAQLRLKNKLRDAHNELLNYGMNETGARNYLEPAENLLYDQNFWRNQSDCLVIFLNEERMKLFTLPVQFKEYAYVSDHFYVLPIMSLFNDDGLFYVLTLSLKDVKLLECTRYSITGIIINDLTPGKLEYTVGYDFQERSLQFRTGQGGAEGALYHGQGAGKDDKEDEIRKHFRAVDKGILKILGDGPAPLVLACVDQYYPLYAGITGYKHLFKHYIKGNHDGSDPWILHEHAWLLVEDHFRQDRFDQARRIRDLSATGKTSFELNDIIKASVDGRVETMFVNPRKDRFGLYDKVNRSLIIDDHQTSLHASLFNLAAVQTWLLGGQVFLIDNDDEMPFKGTGINALFRY